MEIVKGKKTKCSMISVLGEEARISLQQGLEFSPTTTEEQIPEFDNDEAAVIITTLDKYDASLTYLESSDEKMAAIIMGIPLTSEVVPVVAGRTKDVAWIANCKGDDGKVFRCFVAKPGSVKALPVSVQVDGNKNAKRVDLSHPMVYDIFKAEAVRDKLVSTDFSENAENQNHYEAALSATPVELPAGTVADSAQKFLFVRKNGEVVTEGFSITEDNKLDIGVTEPEASDFWEVFYVKTPA